MWLALEGASVLCFARLRRPVEQSEEAAPAVSIASRGLALMSSVACFRRLVVCAEHRGMFTIYALEVVVYCKFLLLLWSLKASLMMHRDKVSPTLRAWGDH